MNVVVELVSKADRVQALRDQANSLIDIASGIIKIATSLRLESNALEDSDYDRRKM